VGDAGKAVQAGFAHLRFEFGHARGRARAGQAAVQVHGNAAGVVASVFEALQALDQDGGDITFGNCTDNTAHGEPHLKIINKSYRRASSMKYAFSALWILVDNFTMTGT